MEKNNNNSNDFGVIKRIETCPWCWWERYKLASKMECRMRTCGRHAHGMVCARIVARRSADSPTSDSGARQKHCLCWCYDFIHSLLLLSGDGVRNLRRTHFHLFHSSFFFQIILVHFGIEMKNRTSCGSITTTWFLWKSRHNTANLYSFVILGYGCHVIMLEGKKLLSYVISIFGSNLVRNGAFQSDSKLYSVFYINLPTSWKIPRNEIDFHKILKYHTKSSILLSNVVL